MNGLWYQKSATEVVEQLGSDLHKGLTEKEAAQLLEKNGPNELQGKPRATLWERLLAQFKDFLVLILIAASAVSAFVGEVTDSLVIVTIVVLNAALGVFQESKAEKALEALQKMAAPNSKVVRGGVIQTIPSRELVVGDIVLLEAGDYIPADVRILESMNLKVEEASLTGESVPVDKEIAAMDHEASLADRHNMGYMGTVATYGRGRAVVIGTGMDTEIGKIAEMISSFEDQSTPLQEKLASFGKVLGLLCLAVCAVVFILGIYQGYRDGNLTTDEVTLLFMTAVSLAVAAIPEGLPAVVTIVLAIGMQRMVKKNSIVKKLHAVETLGSTTVICSDKTGTLTQNQMTVVRLFADGELLEVSGEGYTPEGTFSRNGSALDVGAESGLKLLLEGSALCNDAVLQPGAEDKGWRIAGDPTEGALVVVASKAGFDSESINEKFPRVQEIPFDSARKMMTTFHRQPDGSVRAFVKGAPDILLNRCNKISSKQTITELTDTVRESIFAANSAMAKKALRVLAVGYRDFPEVPANLEPGQIEKDLIFVGLLGMIDPPRAEAREAVKICTKAGIRAIMITGDYRDTALAVAMDLGIAQGEHQVVTGQELNAMSKEELCKVVKKASVFARVSPEHKVAIVEAFQCNNEIAAMTGDGVNDAPALKKADIGVAMGITGTDVTKETADMVLTDDNFASIVAAVEEGRVIFANIRKFVFFLMSCNLAEIFVVFFAMILGWPIPLLPIQLLWLNLVTDAFPALALGMEKPEPGVMDQQPRDPQEPLLNSNMKKMIVVQSSVLTFAVLGAFCYALAYLTPNFTFGAPITPDLDLTMARTFAFTTMISAELLRAYTTRSEHYSVFKIGLFSNKFMNLGVGVSFALLMLALYGPLHEIFRTQTLGLSEWGIIGGFAILPFIAGEIGKQFMDLGASSRKKTEEE
ncbi:MAG TPA: cation-translocating P-type ATPase [Negativicutes bacterium]|nr:cation-translocating P-type ATPase [Negativicutes bacterium]